MHAAAQITYGFSGSTTCRACMVKAVGTSPVTFYELMVVIQKSSILVLHKREHICCCLNKVR